ncbi:beta-glucuronidase [uncultured Granulicatella sp.]|jgi:beta-glucuronidase|uniref:beta-glucuronidase n=1 Tax=Granulicatella adiacens TaxID=46124 RepID=UPI0028DC81B0|nr:beta-glucuronidase [uncultured Granulicatella sp.]
MLYPVLNAKRKRYSLDGVWNFKQGEYVPGVDPRLSTEDLMVVPSSFNDVAVESEKRYFIGDNWYERTFAVPSFESDEELVLRFGSVTHQAKVYVNGQLLGEHIGGFTPFEVRIPEELTREKELLISVCANNILDHTTLPVGNYSEEKLPDGTVKKKVSENFDFFNYAGIQRPVQLLVLPKARIEDIVVTYDVHENDATVKVVVEHTANGGTAKVTLLDEDGEVVAKGEAESELEIVNVRRWEVLDAYLYTAKVELFAGDELVDEYEELFGVRTVRVEKGQFLVNDKPVYFKGFGKHEDSYVNGRGFNEAVNLMDLNLMKNMGANSYRTAHYPYSEEMMRLSDRMGFLVIDEVPAVGLFANFTAALSMNRGGTKPIKTWEFYQTMENHKLALKELVARDKNHACVVLWSVANEPDGAGEGADKYFEPLVKYVKELDPQKRPTTVVNIMMATPEQDLISPLIDVLCLNRYYGWYLNHGDIEGARVGLRKELKEWQEKYPDKPIIMTEYGADTLPGYHSNWDVPYTEEYQERFHQMSHEVFDELENFVGEHVWNFADFETNSYALIRIQGNHKGLFTRDRNPKSIVKLFRNRWNAIPDYNYKK